MPRQHPLKLLVVAAHPRVPSIIADIIHGCGQPCETVYAADETEAIQKIPALRPDVIILDADSSRQNDALLRCLKIRQAFPCRMARILYLGWNLNAATVEGIHLVGGAVALSKVFTKASLLHALKELVYENQEK